MRLTQDKSLARNLRLLHSCSKIEEIYLRSLDNAATNYVKYLDSKEGKPFRRYLEHAIDEMFESRGDNPIVIESTPELLGFLPDKNLVPAKYMKDFEIHRDIHAHLDDLRDLDMQLAEHKKLQQLAKASTNGTGKLLGFMHSENNSERFQHFSKKMRVHSPSTINFKHFQLAMDVAQKNGLYTPEFRKKLRSTLPKPTLDLCKDFVGRAFSSTVKLVPTLALSASIVLGAHQLKQAQATELPETNIPSASDTYIQNGGDTLNLSTLEQKFTPPISPVENPHTYEEACEIFYNKLEEAYKHKTGNNIDLSEFDRSNIGYASTTIYIANYQGETYRFSGFSSHRSNETYLIKALSDAGATITTESSNITYIFNDKNQSIAIIDSHGNPVRSGNVLEAASNGYEMYNQKYVRNAGNFFNTKGIDTSNMSESELIGKYILSYGYNIQDKDLSEILGGSGGYFAKSADTIRRLFKRS